MRKNFQYARAVVLVCFVLSIGMNRASAQNFTIIPPGAARSATGMTYGEWSAVWWQYVLSKSVTDPHNPLLDETGKGCAVDQPRSSPVFFLAGTTGSGTVVRNECTVPAGKVLFFPLVNAFDVHVAGDGLDTPELVRHDLLANLGFSASELHASIDGVAITNLDPQNTPYRACAGGAQECAAAFSITFPGNNLFSGSPAGIGRRGKPPLQAGVYSPAVADGFYLMLALAPGAHQITFGGTGFLSGAFSQEVTYNLSVR